MIAVFAGGGYTVVTARTITGDIGVIKTGGCPRPGRVALIALCAGAEMVWMFACRNHTVMATAAIADNRSMID